MVPFQLVIIKSSPSARPYEQASSANVSATAQQSDDSRSAYLRSSPFRPSRALQAAGSFVGLWRTCWRWDERTDMWSKRSGERVVWYVYAGCRTRGGGVEVRISASPRNSLVCPAVKAGGFLAPTSTDLSLSEERTRSPLDVCGPRRPDLSAGRHQHDEF